MFSRNITIISSSTTSPSQTQFKQQMIDEELKMRFDYAGKQPCLLGSLLKKTIVLKPRFLIKFARLVSRTNATIVVAEEIPHFFLQHSFATRDVRKMHCRQKILDKIFHTPAVEVNAYFFKLLHCNFAWSFPIQGSCLPTAIKKARGPGMRALG